MRRYEVALQNVDTSALRTEEDLLEAAEKYLPDVLRYVGEEIAAGVWDRCAAGVKDENAPYLQPEKRDEYIRASGRAYVEKVSPKVRASFRDMIVERLRERMQYEGAA